MDRLLRMDKDEYLRAMRSEVDRVLSQIADAVHDAPDGKVINASEGPVRDLLAELRQTAFQKAVQMRINSTELSFSPSEGRVGAPQASQGPVEP